MIYVVLGMHKSGTTLVARTLHESGIWMGEFDSRLGYERGNKHEWREFQELNRELLTPFLLPDLSSLRARRRERRDGASATDEAGYPRNGDSRAWVRSAALNRHLSGDLLAERERMRSLVAACSARHTDWGFKDPRTCLTYPAWRSVLPEHRLIVVFRSLAQVLARYAVSPRRPLRMLRVVRAWSLHNAMILEHLKESEAGSTLVLHFEELMRAGSTAEFARLERFTGRELRDVRESALYRSRSRAEATLPRWMEPALAALPMNLDPRTIERRFERLAA